MPIADNDGDTVNNGAETERLLAKVHLNQYICCLNEMNQVKRRSI